MVCNLYRGSKLTHEIEYEVEDDGQDHFGRYMLGYITSKFSLCKLKTLEHQLCLEEISDWKAKEA